jgi:hypothetical protein
MSVSNIPDKVKIRLWGKAAGRCQYEGCNKPLWLDSLTKTEFNTAYIAHIVADSPDGPRGNDELSEKLSKDISNLMLMCDEHHRLIDREDVDGHSVERLQEMKHKHEARIELQTSITEEKQSHILLYRADIGINPALVNRNIAANAMMPEWYPASHSAIELGVGNNPFEDHEQEFWAIERESLKRSFLSTIRPELKSGNIHHLSVFAIGSQPLLIELGRLLSDIPTAEVYQLHREPNDWCWQENPSDFDYKVVEPEKNDGKIVALNISLSGTITEDRIHKVLGDDVSIWTLTIDEPNNDYLKSREQLVLFRCTMRKLFDQIKATHGEGVELHVFPAAPVAINVELGRVWMPKADLNMAIYDQNKSHDKEKQSDPKFIPAFDIKYGE